MNTNSANSIAEAASAAVRTLATSLPAAGQELADGAQRAGEQLSAGLDGARERLGDGRTRLADALEAAAAATRTGLRSYRRRAERQLDDAAERAQELRAAIKVRGRDGVSYSAELGGRAVDQLQSIGARMLKSATRHPYAAVGIVAAACYLIVRRIARRPVRAKAAAAAAKKRARRPRTGAARVRAKESRAGNGSASA